MTTKPDDSLLKNIRLIAMDVDGVLTDGQIHYTSGGEEIKSYCVKDGQGITLLKRAEIKSAIITARTSQMTYQRATELGVDFLFQNTRKKLEKLTEISEKEGIPFEQMAYIGDDLPDARAMQKVALACCPADAVDDIKELCQYVATKKGGEGAVREVIDMVLKAQGAYPDLSAPA